MLRTYRLLSACDEQTFDTSSVMIQATSTSQDEQSADGVACVAGKSACIICPDADIDEAVRIAHDALFFNHGELVYVKFAVRNSSSAGSIVIACRHSACYSISAEQTTGPLDSTSAHPQDSRMMCQRPDACSGCR